MTDAYTRSLVLSIYPTTRGFGFVLFEGPNTPFDWGVKEIKAKSKNTVALDHIRAMIERYRPEALVIEDTSERGSRRTSRIRKLYRMLVHLAEAEVVELHRYGKADIRGCFSSIGAGTKYEIAKSVATQIPAFAHRLPKPRKPWMSEDPRMSLFDAAALGITYYCTEGSHVCIAGPSARPRAQ